VDGGGGGGGCHTPPTTPVRAPLEQRPASTLPIQQKTPVPKPRMNSTRIKSNNPPPPPRPSLRNNTTTLAKSEETSNTRL